MKALVSVLLFVLTVRSYDVQVWGNTGEHDKFFEELSKHDITFSYSDEAKNLQENRVWQKDAVIICLDDVSEASTSIVDFLNTGHSAIVFLNDQSSQLFDTLQEFGVDVNDTFADPSKCSYSSLDGLRNESDVTCGGFPIITDQLPHSVSYTPFVSEDGNAYAVAVQGKNDARLVVFGGEKFGEDDQLADDPKGFAATIELALWAFRRNGVMRARNLTYVRLLDGDVNPPELTISDYIDFSIILETYDETKQEWVPYDANDVQLDFTMLVPRIRKTLKSYHNGTFGLRFQIPDIFGVYQFILDYHARGFTPLNVTHQLMVHPLRHDEQPRFVKGAYPFYVASFIMGCAVVCLCIVIARSAPIFLETPAKGGDAEKDKKKKEKSSSSSSSPAASPSPSKKSE